MKSFQMKSWEYAAQVVWRKYSGNCADGTEAKVAKAAKSCKSPTLEIKSGLSGFWNECQGETLPVVRKPWNISGFDQMREGGRRSQAKLWSEANWEKETLPSLTFDDAAALPSRPPCWVWWDWNTCWSVISDQSMLLLILRSWLGALMWGLCSGGDEWIWWDQKLISNGLRF